jgi:hypothetical protein
MNKHNPIASSLRTQLNRQLFYMLINGQVTVGATEKVNYEVKEGKDIAAEPGELR